MEGRVCLVTGGTSGVGKATARGLARLGAKVVLLCRSAERGQQALDDIARETGNLRGEVLVGDLSLQASIRTAVAEFRQRFDRLDVLANLGGVLEFTKHLTPEGFDTMFSVNYLGPFLLTTLLLDVLEASGPSRVVTVAGAPRFLQNPSIDLDDLQHEKKFSGMGALAQAMFCRVSFGFELAQRLKGTGVTSVVFHPGSVQSHLAQNAPWWLKVLTSPLAVFFGLSARKDCDVAVYLASSTEVEGASGIFFDDHRQTVSTLRERHDAAAGRRLWELSEGLVALPAGSP